MKHYIRLDGTKIIKGFSSAFEQPVEGDILIAENTGQRHFILSDTINPALTDEQGIAKYKYEKGKISARTKTEIDADIAKIPAPEPSEMKLLKSRLSSLENELVKKEIITEAEKLAIIDSR